MDRFLIRASDDRQFTAAREALIAARVSIIGESERYRFLWTEDLSPDLRTRITETGAAVYADRPILAFDEAAST